ncbi:hypothetical protein D3C72_1405770 [compost metagenome]
MVVPGRVVERCGRLQAGDIVVSLGSQHVIADMIGNNINDDFDAERMRTIHKLLQLLLRAEVRIRCVRVLHVIPVIGRVATSAVVIAIRHLRLSDRRDPDRCITHVVDVGKFVDNALPVSAFHITEIFFGVLSVPNGRASRIVRRIAVIEPVDHNLVDRVVLIHSADTCRLHLLGRNDEDVHDD